MLINKKSVRGYNRAYVQRVAPVFNTSYIPNLTFDTLVIASVNISADDTESSTIFFDIDTGAGFTPIASVSNSFNVSGVLGVTGTSAIGYTITALVPAGSSYRLRALGTADETIISIYELKD